MQTMKTMRLSLMVLVAILLGVVDMGWRALAQDTPEAVVAAFLDAWNARDLETMYSYVSPQSQELYPFGAFQSRYELANNTLNMSGITYEIRDSYIQGLTAAVTYDVTIESVIFGSIVDTDRIMRLVQTGASWRIAWSSMDIFEAMAGQANLRVDSRPNVRANIYDRNGELLVEENGTVVVLYGRQLEMRDVGDCIDLLAHLLLRPRNDLANLFAQYLDDTVFYIGEMDLERYVDARFDLENTCGIYPDDDDPLSRVRQRTTRRYYGNGAAAHITGYVGVITAEQEDFWRSRGYHPGDIVGQTGIELGYQDTLGGQAERLLVIAEPGGTTLQELGGSTGSPPAPVQLTIDRDLQLLVAEALVDAHNYALPNWGGVTTGTAAVVIDVNTGEILAMASWPTFDPSWFNVDTVAQNIGDLRVRLLEDPRRPLINKAVADRFSPGSTFKIITAAAAAQEGVFGMDEIFDCQLTWDGTEYGDTQPVRYDWRYTDELEPAGEVTMAQALTASCNPFFFTMGGLLFRKNPALLGQYAERFGFGPKTGVGLPEEVGSQVSPPRTADEAISYAVGQASLEIVPLQMARAVAAVANRGTLYQPFIVQQVGGFDNTPITAEFEPEIVGDLGLDDEVFDMLFEGMCAVTANKDFGTAYRVFGDAPYTVCGKTGTAQTLGNPNAWFVAFTPAQDPQIAVVVVSANSREGSEVAAPIARRIMDDYWNVSRKPFPEWWRNPYIPVRRPEEVSNAG